MSAVELALDALKDRVRGVFSIESVNGPLGGGSQFPYARVYMGDGNAQRMDLSQENGFCVLVTDFIVEIHFAEEKYEQTEASAHTALEQFLNELTQDLSLDGTVQRINPPINHQFRRLVSGVGQPLSYGYQFRVNVTINLDNSGC